MSDQEFQFTDEPVEDQAAPQQSPDYKPYSEMDWGEYLKEMGKNAPADFWKQLTALPSALYNYDETGRALYQLGSGIASKLSDVPLVATYTPEGEETRVVPSVREMFGTPRSPEEKAAVEAPVEQFATGLVEPFTSKEAALRAAAESPFGTLSTLSIPVTGGASALTKGAQLTGKAASLAKGIEKAGTIMDPTGAVIEAGKLGGNLGRQAVQKAQAAATGAPSSAFSKAFDAAYMQGPQGEQYRKDFMSYLKGDGSASDFAKSVNDAFKVVKKEASDQWFAEKGDILGLRSTPVDFNPIYDKFNELRTYYGSGSPTGQYAHADANSALDEAQNAVLAYATSNKIEDRTIVGLDKLKQRLYDLADKQSDREAKNAVMGVWASVRQQIANTSPEYDALMSGYQTIEAEMKDLQKTLGAGNQNVSQNTILAKHIAGQKTPQKQQLIDKLVEVDPSIAYKIAGATLHGLTPVGLPQKLLEAGSAVPWSAGAFNAVMQGQPITAAALMAGYGAQALAQSPRAMAKTDYAMGRTSGLTAPVVAPVAKAAETAAPYAVTFQGAQERGRPVFEFTDAPVTEQPEEQASGGRVARKSGGRIKANAISAEVKRVRTLLSQKTASMLSLPDDAIATALHLAKRT